MRVKFKKGMTPERMADAFVNFIRERDIVIGAVNMYIQAYDEEMKPEKFHHKGAPEDYYECTPSKTAIKEYEEDVARIRRKRMKAIV